MSRKSNRYTEEFRADVIRMINEGGRSINDVAKDLGVNDQTIRNWLKMKKTIRILLNQEYPNLKHRLKTKIKR